MYYTTMHWSLYPARPTSANIDWSWLSTGYNHQLSGYMKNQWGLQPSRKNKRYYLVAYNINIGLPFFIWPTSSILFEKDASLNSVLTMLTKLLNV